MEASNERWIDNLQFSSLFSPPPRDAEERNAQITNYVEFFRQFVSERFPDDLAELIRRRYPSEESTLFDDVLATFVLRHPEHARAVTLAIVSCINDGFLEYDKNSPPFASLIPLICPKRKEYSACGEMLRILTHYNRPIYKADSASKSADKLPSCSSSSSSSSSNSSKMEKKLLRPLTPWITDMLLQVPLDVRIDYFRWCGGVAVDAEFEPSSTTASSHGSVLMTSTPTWAVANGAAVILSVCDEELSLYETCTLTAAAVPAVLLPPSSPTPKDEHPVAGVPALEPYACLFHRYYANASPSVAQKLLLTLLEAPPSWAHYALEDAVQLVELLRAADDSASGIKLPRNWMYSYFLRAIGIAMSMKDGTAADSAAALLFRILSQPDLLFPVTELQTDYFGSLAESDQLREATAQEIASMLRAHGLDVEYRICKIWEAAYGLIPAPSPSTDLPDFVVSTSLQPPVLSWSLCIPLLKVLEYLPRGSPTKGCLMKILIATFEAVLGRTFASREQDHRGRNAYSDSKNLSTELRTMLHSLFLGPCASVEIASRLLFVVFTVCVSEEGRFRRTGDDRQGPIAAFYSYVIASICALSFELHTYSLLSKKSGRGKCRAIAHTRRILAILEALVSTRISCVETLLSCSSEEIIPNVMAAANICDLFRRSKDCMQSLLLLRRRKWDKEIRCRANSLFNLIDSHCKTVASIAEKAKAMEDPSLQGQKYKNFPHCEKLTGRYEKAESSEVEKHAQRPPILLLVEKQEMCFLVVSLLWRVLVASSEVEMKGESSSSLQAMDALSKVVSASPAKAATATVLQAGRELKAWIVKDDKLGRRMRRINRRVVEVVAELMKNHENSEALMIMATSSDLLLRATDGILVDAEACILPQLQLLEAAAGAVEPLLEEHKESGFAAAEAISNLLKLRLPATAGCVSHPSGRVRGLGASVLRSVVRVGTTKSRCECSSSSLGELRDGVVKCLRWEAHSRLAMGLPIHMVEAAAEELGFTIST